MRNRHSILIATTFVVAALSIARAPARAGVIENFASTSLGGGSRWDAAPRTVFLAGENLERSLGGGLRFSLQGGSYQAFRDNFSWAGATPSVADFTAAVNQAFNCWTATDPSTGLGTSLYFVPDLGTPVVGKNDGSGGWDPRGAEIDLFASPDAGFWDRGDNTPRAENRVGAIGSTVTLTSGTPDYPASTAIAGADIIFNDNPGAFYTLDLFRRILANQVGHAIGLGSAEGDLSGNAFIDDNYDPSTSDTARATLTNSWAALVNPLDPGASPGLRRYTVASADPGTITPGVDLLLESRGYGVGPTNPLTNLIPLTNDEFGTRQFLYPQLPEPSQLKILSTAIAVAGTRRRRRPALRRIGRHGL